MSRIVFVTGVVGNERQWALALQAVASSRRHTARFADIAVLCHQRETDGNRYAKAIEKICQGTIGLIDDGMTWALCNTAFKNSVPRKGYPPIVMAKWHLKDVPILAYADRVVWFDTDMTALRDLEELASIDNQKGLSAVRDEFIRSWEDVDSRMERYGVAGPTGRKPPDSPYYNVGLLVIDKRNLPIGANPTFVKTDVIADQEAWHFRDQDTINAAFDISPLDTKFNRDWRVYGADGGDGAAIVHYPGAKPSLLFHRAEKELEVLA